MSKEAEAELGAFIDDHPTTAIVELLSILANHQNRCEAIDNDVVSAYLLRVANCEGLPEPIRALADQLYKEWDIDRVSTSASAFLSFGGMLH